MVRSEHDEPHDLNDELRGRAPGRAAPTGETGPPIVLPGSEWMREALLPDADELVPTAPGFLYARSPVVCHADRGAGKTTYAAFAASEASRTGLDVLLLLDDDPGTWARRMQGFGADLARVGVARNMSALAQPGALERACKGVDVVILDSWRRWAQASGMVKRGDLNDESQVGPAADRICNIARGEDGPAFLVLANEAKSAENTTARGRSPSRMPSTQCGPSLATVPRPSSALPARAASDCRPARGGSSYGRAAASRPRRKTTPAPRATTRPTASARRWTRASEGT